MTPTTIRLAAALALATLALTACAQPSTVDSPSPTGSAESAEVTEGAGGFGEVPADDTTTEAPNDGPADQPPPVAPANVDCVSFDPFILTVEARDGAWLLRSGSHAMKIFDTKADADNGLKVAKNWRQLCFIGRNNTRPDRYSYIITYWRTPSNILVGAPVAECIPYNPSKLAIYSGSPHPANPAQLDWALYSGGTPLVFLASEADALRAKLVAAESSKVCVIGHGNDRPDPGHYILYYWIS